MICVKVVSMTKTTTEPLPVRGYLANKGISLREFAESIERSPAHVSRVVHRRRPVTQAFALAAARRLGLSLDETTLLLGPRETWNRGRWPSGA